MSVTKTLIVLPPIGAGSMGTGEEDAASGEPLHYIAAFFGPALRGDRATRWIVREAHGHREPRGERAMTVQEVVLKALSGELHWFQAADILGMSPRTLRRWRER